MELPCIPQSVALVRAKVGEIVRQGSFSATDADDIMLAVGEASANAVRRGRRFVKECRIRARCWMGPHNFSVAIPDPGGGFDPETVPSPAIGACREGAGEST